MINDYLEQIKGLKAFEGIEKDDDILWLQKCMDARIVKFQMGDTAFREGEEQDCAYFLLEGSAIAVKDGELPFRIESGESLMEKPPKGYTQYAPYTLLADTDLTLLSLKIMRLSRLCNFRCVFHARLLDNISHI